MIIIDETNTVRPSSYYDLKFRLCVRAIGIRYDGLGEIKLVVRSIMDNINLQYSVPFEEFLSETQMDRRFVEVVA